MCESIGHPVLRLKRVSFGPLELGGLPQGKWRLLRPEEVDLLNRWAISPPSGQKR
jgi:23S rRNA pseudouridine2605 synthase